MPVYRAVILAIIQGLAEFIPVSSSGHLIVVRRLLGWNELSPAHELTFDVALHAGTLLSVLIYFRRTWIQIIRAALGGKVVRFSEETDSPARDLTPEEARRERLLLWFLALATIPGAIAGKLLEHSAEDYFREHVFLVAAAMIVVALIMWWSEKYSSFRKPLPDVTFTDSLIVGCAQATALIPGVSRSGSTITAGLFRNMTRDAAVRFSFLLATPIIAGAALVKAHEVHKEGIPPDMRAPFAVGIAVSAIVGYIAIAWLIRYLRTKTLTIFIVYRIIFGIIVIALAYSAHLH